MLKRYASERRFIKRYRHRRQSAYDYACSLCSLRDALMAV